MHARTLVVVAVALSFQHRDARGDQAGWEDVERQIQEAAACRSTSQCMIIEQKKCPYGCVIAINRKNKDKVTALLKSAPDICKMSCDKVPKVKVRCERKLCQIKTEQKNKISKADAARLGNCLERIFRVRELVAHRPDILTRLHYLERELKERLPTKQDLAYLSQLEMAFTPPRPKKRKR